MEDRESSKGEETVIANYNAFPVQVDVISEKKNTIRVEGLDIRVMEVR